MTDRPHRRLSDKIGEAHRQACAENKRDVAEHLFRALEADLSALGAVARERRQSTEVFVDAFETHVQLNDA